MAKSNSSSFWDHPIETIERGLNIRKQIETLKKQVAQIVGGELPAPFPKRRGRKPKTTLSSSGTTDGRKGKRSAATIAKMRAAQKARWAAKKGVVVDGGKKKRTLSPEARAKIAAAQKARWAKVKG